MNMTNLCLHASSERLTLYFYGELSDGERRAFDEHVASCDACTASLTELALMRSALAARADVSRPPGEWDAFMGRLLLRLKNAGHGDGAARQVPTHRPLGWRALAVAAALLLAVGAGVTWQRAVLSPGNTRSADAGSGEIALSAAAEQHLERAKLVVLGLAMKDPAQTTAADWEYERGLAESLLPETRLFRLSAADRGDTRLANLLGDLESVLLQASMSAEAEPSELERLQRVIRRRDLLVRMDLREL